MNKNIKVIDDHNIDRNANVMFAVELEGSEYVVYWIERDTESNNVFVSKVLRDVDGTYNMLNIEEADKKEEIANIVKVLISTSVSNQNSKLQENELVLSDGKVAKFMNVSFNKEQKISVQKTYITTVKKDVTNVAEKYYEVAPAVVEPAPVSPAEPTVEVFPSVDPVTPVVAAEPQVVSTEPVAAAVVEPVLPTIPEPVAPAPVAAAPVMPEVVAPVVEPAVVVEPTPVAPTPQVIPSIVQPAAVTPEPVAPAPVVAAASVQPTPVAPVEPVAVPEVKTEPFAVQPTPVVPEPIPDAFSQPLVFNASKEKNLNAALGEVADATNIPVESIQPVKEFGVDEPVAKTVTPEPVAPAPAVAAAPVQPTPVAPKAGFANSKFFVVVAIVFFLASCIFLGYEVFNYFQLIK